MRSILLGLVLAFSFSTFASETTKGMKKDYDAFKTEMSEQLTSVEKKIEELKVKAKQKGSATQEETIAGLEKTKEKLKTELAEAKESGKDNWSKFKASFAKSVDNLNTKIQKAVKD